MPQEAFLLTTFSNVVKQSMRFETRNPKFLFWLGSFLHHLEAHFFLK
jgi:hypothetical protein